MDRTVKHGLLADEMAGCEEVVFISFFQENASIFKKEKEIKRMRGDGIGAAGGKAPVPGVQYDLAHVFFRVYTTFSSLAFPLAAFALVSHLHVS